MIRVGLVGCGYWGPNLLRNFMDAEGSEVASISDLQSERLDPLKRRYPTLEATTDWRSVVADPRIDAIAIATPVYTHFEIALEALRAGKHVLVEKPLASNTDQSRQLVDEAERRGLVLMVDHTFVYTGAVRRIHDLVREGELGQLYYYDSVRINLGLFHHDVNVVWDLAVHDLSILSYVIPEAPRAVSATGMSHVNGSPEDIAYLTLHYEGSLIAHLHVNWLAPVKVRRTLIGGSRKMVVYDELEPSEKVKIYDRGITVEDDPESVYQMQIAYRAGDMWAPRLDLTEALRNLASHFVSCIDAGTRADTDGAAGLRVVSLLEAASRSMADQGRPVDVNPE